MNKKILIGKMNGVMGYFFHCYFNDLMAPIFFLSICSIVLKWAGCKTLNLITLIILGMSAGFVWEYFAPVINNTAVTDPVDLVCYFMGTITYYIITKK